MPTAFRASWGKAGPTILLASDIDAVLGTSQMPGTSSLRPLVAGAPGHGEGHHSGMAVIIAAAQALKSIMEEHDLGGQPVILPGVAEELLGSKDRSEESRGGKGCVSTFRSWEAAYPS